MPIVLADHKETSINKALIFLSQSTASEITPHEALGVDGERK